jgi:cell division protein FtsA
MIEVAGGPDGAEPLRISRAQLISVIRVRLEHWFAAIEEALKALGFTGPIARRLVLTGGGAELKGIADYAQGVLGRSVRVGRPRGLIGMPEAHSGMSFSTLAGLVLYAASDPIDLRIVHGPQPITRMSPSGMVQRLIAAVRSNY